MTTPLTEVIVSVERELARFYAFDPHAEANGHIMTVQELKASLGSYAESKPEFAAPGGVWVLPTTDADELFIGIHFASSVSDALERQDPRVALGEENLEAFCVVVEEISHFHLILNRAQAGLHVTKLELECQGEIDKLLLSAMFLERQSGNAHILPLARKLYDQATITSPDVDLYWQATKHAARFWFDLARNRHLRVDSLALKNQLRLLYRNGMAGKLATMSKAS